MSTRYEDLLASIAQTGQPVSQEVIDAVVAEKVHEDRQADEEKRAAKLAAQLTKEVEAALQAAQDSNTTIAAQMEELYAAYVKKLEAAEPVAEKLNQARAEYDAARGEAYEAYRLLQAKAYEIPEGQAINSNVEDRGEVTGRSGSGNPIVKGKDIHFPAALTNYQVNRPNVG